MPLSARSPFSRRSKNGRNAIEAAMKESAKKKPLMLDE
jgi:hypothetical protein